MYISGHLEILEDIITKLPKDFFTKDELKELEIGLIYPDKPCGRYEISDLSIKFNKKICEITKLLRMFDDKHFGESKVYQFHKGYFTHLHSMSTDSNNSVLKMRNKIIVSILGYSLLTIYDDTIFSKNPVIKPNTFWLGIILHIITDSYSPAHTIRDPKIPTTKINLDTNIDIDKQMRLDVHEIIKSLAKKSIIFKDKDEFIITLAKEVKDAKDFINSQSRSLWKIYKVFKFEYDTNKLINRLLKNNKIDLLKTQNNNKNNYGDIISFQYYPEQSMLMHLRLDLLTYVKDNPRIYKRLINECLEVLKLYKEVLETKDINKFILNMYQFIITRTFNINKKYLKNDTSLIINSQIL
jgi:hypothetical protein